MKRRTDTSAEAMTRRTGGFTLLEMSIALVLFALVVGNVYTILDSTSKGISERSAELEVEAQAERALSRIALAIVGSFEGSLHVTAEIPNGEMSTLNYAEFLGMDDLDGDGVDDPVNSAPMRIAWAEGENGAITWYENPDLEDEKRVIWVKDVPSVARGEVAANGVDDNGNGIVDEKGLAFVKDGRMVRILLTLRRPDGQGGFLEKQLETTVTCRN